MPFGNFLGPPPFSYGSPLTIEAFSRKEERKRTLDSSPLNSLLGNLERKKQDCVLERWFLFFQIKAFNDYGLSLHGQVVSRMWTFLLLGFCLTNSMAILSCLCLVIFVGGFVFLSRLVYSLYILLFFKWGFSFCRSK